MIFNSSQLKQKKRSKNPKSLNLLHPVRSLSASMGMLGQLQVAPVLNLN